MKGYQKKQKSGNLLGVLLITVTMRSSCCARS